MAENESSKENGMSRIISKIKTYVDAGKFYEAHQMYKVLYFRYIKQKKYDQLLKYLSEGAIIFFNHNQSVSGADLSNLYVDVLCESYEPVNAETCQKLSKLLGLMSPNLAERDTFINKALKWSTRVSSVHKAGHPFLHREFAKIFWEEKNFVIARYHFLHSRDESSFARMLVEIHRSYGFACEVDLFIAQVVLQFLCHKNRESAHSILLSYTALHPSIRNGPPYVLPLLNFLWLLLKAVKRGRLAAFTVLLERYEVSIRRDPSYTEYLDKIAQIFFGVPPPASRNRGGFLDNFLQSILMNGNEFDSDEGEPDNSSQTFSEPSCSFTRQRELESEELD